ncbi:MAG TPA: aspartate aminotransferase family protein [Halanaerobiales bacterium]|nr:aspartate aminotransferase family protein [Halanaerobiales bacterium]
MSELYNIDQALSLSREEVGENYKNHINPAMVKMLKLLNFDKNYVKADNVEVYDEEGRKFLDFLGGYGSLNLGHNRDEIIEAVNKVTEKPNLLQASLGGIYSAAAHNLAQVTPGDLSISFFGNSGTEAVEGAIKLARAATEKEKIIYCKDSFHGKSYGSLSITGRDKYQKHFNPLLPATEEVPFGDIKALREKLNSSSNIAAVILEPIQGEGGVIVPPAGYLKEVRDLCNEKEVLMILDEIQTGLGRTGRLFAADHEGVVPDIMCLAKSLGGGIEPVGAYISKPKIWNQAYGSMEKALLHTSTFGGNARASAAVIASINYILTNDLSEQAAEKGEYFLEQLKKFEAEYDLVKEVRGRGLMIGIEFNQPDPGLLDRLSGGLVSKFSAEYMGAMVAGSLNNDYRVITAYTLNNPNVIRLEPPLTVSYEQIDYVVDSLQDIFEKNSNLFNLTMKSAQTAIKNFFN